MAVPIFNKMLHKYYIKNDRFGGKSNEKLEQNNAKSRDSSIVEWKKRSKGGIISKLLHKIFNN